MSLYADEELGTGVDAIDAPIAPATTTPSSSAPSDPLQALAAALSLPAESSQQAEALVAAGQRFETAPERLPELCGQLLPMVVDGGESLLRSWTLDMVALAVGRSALKVDIKSNGECSTNESSLVPVKYRADVHLRIVAQSSLDALNRLLNSNAVHTIKAVIPIFSTIHPILFRIL